MDLAQDSPTTGDRELADEMRAYQWPRDGKAITPDAEVPAQDAGDVERDRDAMLPVMRALARLRGLYADNLDEDRLALGARPNLNAVLAAYDQWVQGGTQTQLRHPACSCVSAGER